MYKKIVFTIATLFCAVFGAQAMSYEQARDQALFLTDKMAYELNLTDDQYNAAYEINLDYLMNVTTVDDVYADCWRQRCYDMQVVLFDWQWNAFCAASYFYRPLYWGGGIWHFGIYAHYPHRDFFYFDRPAIYISYRGGHSWRGNGGHSWYYGHRDHFRSGGGRGMRDSGCYRDGGRNGGSRNGSGNGGSRDGGGNGGSRLGNINGGSRVSSSGISRFNGTIGGIRQSSTRSTLGGSGSRGTGSFSGGGSRGSGSFSGGGSRGSGSFSGGGSRGSGSFSGGGHGGAGGHR